MLLYGPPGCGKTLIAKATAKQAGFRFINLQPSTLTDKWYGESQKLAAAVFSLAVKLQPALIFIDEIGDKRVFAQQMLSWTWVANGGIDERADKGPSCRAMCGQLFVRTQTRS